MRLVLALAAVLVVGCGGGIGQTTPIGNPAVQQRIAAETDCATLQAEFDTASANFDRAPKGTPESAAAISYMDAADNRMKAVGCY